MKITWFGGTTFRIHIAGRIVVVDPEGAPAGIDAAELVSGAETVAAMASGDIPAFDPASWTPRKRGRLIDEDEGDEALSLYHLGNSGLVADSADEGVLVLHGEGAEWRRWADTAVIVLSGSGAECAAAGAALLEIARPRLIALAVDDAEIDIAFETLAPLLGDAGLIVLEAGLAVEV